MDLNKVTIIGNLVGDPKSETLSSGQLAVRFGLATNYVWQEAKTRAHRQAVDFHNIVAYGRLGEIIGQYVKKGAKLYVEGRLRNRRTGDGRAAAEIVAD